MARVKGAMMTRKRRNKVMKMAKGYWGSRSKHFHVANEAVMKALTQAYIGRRLKKRDFRSLWITRISAACKANGMNYSTFMHGWLRWLSTTPLHSLSWLRSLRRPNLLSDHKTALRFEALFFLTRT